MINVNKPMHVKGRPARLIAVLDNGHIVVQIEGDPYASTYNPWGAYTNGARYGMLKNDEPVRKVYTLDIYPSTHNVYRREERRVNPCQSSYPDMFSVVVTEEDGVVVKREFI